MRKLLAVLSLVVFPVSLSWAVGSGGYTNQVVGTKALGMGNAFVATADDPSAIYFNPAGLTQLNQINLSLGLAAHKNDTDYKSNAGVTDSMENATPIVPNFYVTVPFRSKWVFGFGINSPFGLETHWSDTSPLRYVATDSKLHLLNFNPTASYKVNDKISVGGGVVYARASADLKSKINQVAVGGTDANKELSGDGDTWGYNFGVLYVPQEKHRIGLSYRSELSPTVKGEVKLAGLSGGYQALMGANYQTDVETKIKFPQSVIAGYSYKPNKWSFEIDGEWVDYSAVDETKINYMNETDPTRLGFLNAAGNPANRDWHNTWNLGLGTNYEFNETWQARGGYFYYPQAIPNSTWDPSNPESSRNGFTLGGSYVKQNFSVDLAYNLILFNNRKVNNTVGNSIGTSVNGEYKTTAQIVSANFTYKFNTK
ncbi:MAG: outer membrane protein transport protein [Candidatus Omnitrophica bacterium]|nr:outer membrane protein transport protein [Candidatus Omnitrophota bacterium]